MTLPLLLEGLCSWWAPMWAKPRFGSVTPLTTLAARAACATGHASTLLKKIVWHKVVCFLGQEPSVLRNHAPHVVDVAFRAPTTKALCALMMSLTDSVEALVVLGSSVALATWTLAPSLTAMEMVFRMIAKT